MDNDVELNYHFSHCWELNFIPSSAPLESNHLLICVAPPDVFYLFCLPSGQFLNGSYCSFEDGECGWKPISGRGLSWRRAQTPGKVTRQSCSSSGSRKHQFCQKHVNRGLNVPSPEIQELEIKISPWDLLNDCAAYLQAAVVERFPSNDFECLTSAVCRRAEFALKFSGARRETGTSSLTLVVAQKPNPKVRLSSESDICCSTAGASTRLCLTLLSRVLLLPFQSQRKSGEPLNGGLLFCFFTYIYIFLPD